MVSSKAMRPYIFIIIMTEENIEPTAKSFTTRVPMEMWNKIEEYKKYGSWNTNQLMSHALTAFFGIIEDTEDNPELPLVCETLRELKRKNRSRLISSTKSSVSQVEKPDSTPEQNPPKSFREDKPWLNTGE